MNTRRSGEPCSSPGCSWRLFAPGRRCCRGPYWMAQNHRQADTVLGREGHRQQNRALAGSEEEDSDISYGLCNSLQHLESICTGFLETLEAIVNGNRSRLHSGRVRRLSDATDKASAEFLATAKGIVDALEIFDPTLALMLSQLRYGKSFCHS